MGRGFVDESLGAAAGRQVSVTLLRLPGIHMTVKRAKNMFDDGSPSFFFRT